MALGTIFSPISSTDLGENPIMVSDIPFSKLTFIGAPDLLIVDGFEYDFTNGIEFE
jgi:hypothetical protein